MRLDRFTNRLDEIIIFHALTRADLVQVVDIQVRRLRNLLADRHIELRLTEAATRLLAEIGYDPVYGARLLKRTIQRERQDPLALRILEGQFRDGDAVEVDAEKGTFVFKKAAVLAEAA